MENSRYPVIIGKSSMVFEFISDGLNGKVAKLVIYSETDLLDFYNLGFGDKDSSGQIDDKIVTNNGDSQKVLATFASTLYTFTEKFPQAMVLALGSTKARTRLYRIGITNNLTEIEEDFEVFGFAQGDGMKFQKQIELNPLFDTCLNCTSLLIKHL